jgi:hypothetical protein
VSDVVRVYDAAAIVRAGVLSAGDVELSPFTWFVVRGGTAYGCDTRDDARRVARIWRARPVGVQS